MLKVTENKWENGDGDARYSFKIERDGKRILGFRVGQIEPEDATLGRDLDFAYSVVDVLKIGIEAGKAGEDVIFEVLSERD